MEWAPSHQLAGAVAFQFDILADYIGDRCGCFDGFGVEHL
jgi:hypothetical protein